MTIACAVVRCGMIIDRRGFLAATSALSASFVSAPAVAADTPAAAMTETLPDLAFDEARFAEAVNRPARHRQVFAVQNLGGGAPLSFIYASLSAYTQALRVPERDVHIAAVLYHGYGTALAYDDAIWNAYVIPSLAEANAATAPKPASGNPYLHALRDGSERPFSVEALAKRGVSFFVCYNSFRAGAQMFAARAKKPAAEVLAEMRAALAPGAMLVPAGVMALNALQEARFTYASG